MSTARANLEVLVDHLEQYRQRVGELLTGLPTTGSDDAHTALYELERVLGQSVKVAQRALAVIAEQR